MIAKIDLLLHQTVARAFVMRIDETHHPFSRGELIENFARGEADREV